MAQVNGEHSKLLRAMDANCNRASEGLRVVEEVARFVLDDSRLTEELKRIRHAVRVTAEELSGSLASLIAARESDEDVGRPLSTRDSADRKDTAGIVSANMRRAEEGLRVLEELSTSLDIESSNRFKQLRFELYSLEKEIVMRFQN